jgi:hypothetical protein
MNSNYTEVAVAVRPRMMDCMFKLQGHLKAIGFDVSTPEWIESEGERGAGFLVHIDRITHDAIVVDLILTDGDERDFKAHEDGTSPGFGINLTATGRATQVLHQWAPYNLTAQVGTNSIPELFARIAMLQAICGIGVGSAIETSIRAYRDTWYPGRAAQPEAASTMTYSLDGGLTYLQATQGVRVRFEAVQVPGENETGQLDLNITPEGLITDLWVSRDDKLDHNLGTASQQLGNIVGDLAEQGSSGEVERDRS